MAALRGRPVPNLVPGRKVISSSTWPSRPSIRRASSDQGRRPSPLPFSDSVSLARPPAVLNVVSIKLLPGRYRRDARKGPFGAIEKHPPASASSSRSKSGGESSSGTHHQSIDPSRPARATDRPSPIAAYCPIGR